MKAKINRLVVSLVFGLCFVMMAVGMFNLNSQAVFAKPLSTDIGGVITQSTTWVITNSPYILTSDVTVNDDVTLTIEPGVVVKGQTNSELKTLGHLHAVGTASQPITFTSDINTGGDQ
ncbi:MAG: hypothetical protein B6242_04960 [Anaerolineaceae bacterium 4572_78]|nr:MAG: hypothetical protein B6242_04960 [Anaerolineaceae bacterium 4572_78]